MSESVNVLFIEDHPGDARLVKEELRSASSKTIVYLEWVDRLEQGLERLASNHIQAILLDLSLPDSEGLETLRRVLIGAPSLPVIVMTGQANETIAMQAVQAGAQDYLIKGQVDGRLLIRSIQYAIQRKRSEEALRESEERLSGMIGAAMDAIITIDEEQRIILFNPAAEQMFHYSAADVMGQPLDCLLPERARSIHREHVRVFGETRLTRRAMGALGALSGLRADGEEFPIEASISQLESSGQKFYTVILRDITERKRSEEKIQRQLKQLSALRMIDIAISSSFDLHIILDVVLQQVLSQSRVDASAILLFNRELQTIEYAAGRGFRSDVLHYTQLKLGEGYAGQAVLKRETIHIADLMEIESRLVNALEKESFTDYYGIPLIAKGEVKGVLEIYHRTHLQADAEWMEFLETLAGQAAIAIDNAQLFENLQRSNTHLEHRVAERTAELNRTNAELEHANRVKDEFLANMSHELRTPLTSILGLSESLLEQRNGLLNDYQERSLQLVESSGRHLLELINDILDLSKIEAGKFDYYPQPVPVDEICHSSLAFIKAQAVKKSITVTYINEATVSKFFADPRRLKQILVNLLTNAVKFTPENGEVTLQVNADLEQDLIQFSVIDTGIGIAPHDLQRLFQPFVQVESNLNRQYDGTGLGLALVQKLTDLHGGSVQVESELKKGSRFTINLSCKTEEIAKLEAPPPQTLHPVDQQAATVEFSSEVSTSRGVILLAEDNMANILTIGEYLKSHGYEVVIAHDGQESIEKAQALKPDLILMDIQMPVMDGLEAMTRLRRHSEFASTPIIALTALVMPGDRERCLQAGATEYMSKPVSLKALRQTVTELLQSRSDG